MSLDDKYSRLKEILKKMGSVLVAFSGGVDSTLLLKAAVDALGKEKVIAATVVSEIKPKREHDQAKKLAEMFGVRFITVELKQLSTEVKNNPTDRCYHCKFSVFSALLKSAKESGMNRVVCGDNFDDLSDYRPGAGARKELKVAAPLAEAEFTKVDIRELSKQFDLPTWNKPSYPCLASRFPYGTHITEENAKNIDEAEQFIHELGVDVVRVRHHDKIARIEVEEKDVQTILKNNDKIQEKLKSLGYHYAALDLKGFRSGSLNETLDK